MFINGKYCISQIYSQDKEPKKTVTDEIENKR